MIRTGQRSSKWDRVRKKLKVKFADMDITTCEIGLKGCLNDNFLGFAHTKKRRYITTEEDLWRVVLACQPCHAKVEYFCIKWTGKTMTEFLDAVIDGRNA